MLRAKQNTESRFVMFDYAWGGACPRLGRGLSVPGAGPVQGALAIPTAIPFKSTDFPSRRARFKSQYPHGSSQLSICPRSDFLI